MDLIEAYNRVIEGVRSVPVDNFLQVWGAYPIVHTLVTSLEGAHELGDMAVNTDTSEVYVWSGIQWLQLGEKHGLE